MEPRYRPAGVAALAVATGALASAAGLFAAQYAARQGDIGELRQQIAITQGSIAGAQAQQATVASSVKGLDAAWSRLEGTNKDLHACADPARDAVIAAREQDSAAVADAVQKLYALCGR
jgi:hypothetical protein